MDVASLERFWGPLVAGGLLLVVALVVAATLLRRSAHGQLRARRRELEAARRRAQQAERALAAARRKLERLDARADKVRPRSLTEAREAVADAEALAKITSDRVLVSANHLRRVIFEEFPPTRHEALRRRYLPDDGPDSRPFSF